MSEVERMKKICHFCGNKNFKNSNVQYIYKHGGKFLIVNDVPCLQCVYCGEQYFSGEILEKIEEEFNKIYSLGKEVKTEIPVPVEQFAELQQA
jgi:YgiT-type zinc finger domain-containing protein